MVGTLGNELRLKSGLPCSYFPDSSKVVDFNTVAWDGRAITTINRSIDSQTEAAAAVAKYQYVQKASKQTIIYSVCIYTRSSLPILARCDGLW